MPEGPRSAVRDLPLAGRSIAIPDGGLTIGPAPAAVRYVLRCKPEHAGPMSDMFGASIPIVACRAGQAGSRAALWLGPDEWLLIAEDGAQAHIEASFASVA